jgi:O-antigen ligase
MAWVWEPEKIDVANNFAMFRYRGNAGAFMNLVLPLLMIRAWLSFRHAESPGKKAFWVGALFVLVAGIQFNPSRASWCLALGLGLGTVLLVYWILRRLGQDPGGWSAGSLATAGLTGLIAAVSLGAILVLGGWETSWKRILKSGLDGGHRSPVMVYRAMVPDAGWLGFGPGTFETIFPSYQTTHPYESAQEEAHWTRGYWRHAHQDYYQTLIEWGYAGTLAWAAIILGGLGAGWRRIFRDPQDTSLRWVRCASVLALGGVLLHACGDFPLQIASIQLFAATLLGFCWTR